MLKKYFVSILARRNSRYFISGLRHARDIQESIFWRYISQAKDTAYGREMHLSGIRSIKEFQNYIPIQTYEDYLPYIERIKRGEKNILFPERDKLIMFALSSGTTAVSKFIPVTRSFFKAYEQGSLFWGSFMFLSHPGILDGLILPIVSSMEEERTITGIPCGGISGLIARAQRPLARLHYFLPYSVYGIRDTDTKYYTILRLALARRNIRFISSANPSTLITLARYMDAHKEQLIDDISTGSLKIDNTISRDISPHLRKDRKRARELEEIVHREGRLIPASVWPSLYLIACWRGGTVGQYLPLLKEYYGDIPVYELGLLASEGRMSIPLGSGGSHQGVLDIYSNFYEFIPEEEEDSHSPPTLLMHELEKGKRYFIVLTTPYGFFRYHIYDLIEVTDFVDGVPVISFLNKGRHISSLTGEKLTEFQVCTAMKNIGIIKGEEYTLIPCWDNHLPYYTLVIEELRFKGKVEELCKLLDKQLKALNMEYRSKRNSRRLGDIKPLQVPLNTFLEVKQNIIKKRGGRAEQYKQVHLDTQDIFREYIRQILERNNSYDSRRI